MKILCCCAHGYKRSAQMRRLLLYNGHDPLTIGLEKNSPETIEYMANWADVILIAELVMIDRIPEQHRHKVDTRFTVGVDDFAVTKTDPRLVNIVKVGLKKLEYIK